MKKINLKKMSINSGGKTTGYTRLYKKKNGVNIEKCIFCQEEYLRETLCEDVGREKPNILQVSICRSCHACLKDDVVMKEIREIIKKSSFKLDEANKKVEYFCGMCQQKINMNFPTIVCTACNKWIHKRCVTIPWDRAEKNKNVFKCKNCEEKEAPEVTEPIEPIQVDDVEVDENFAKHPEANEGKSNEGDCRANKNKDKSSSGSVANNAPNTGDKIVNAGDTDSGKNGGMPGVPVTQSASQGIDTLRLNLDALKPTSWLQDSHIKIAIEDIEWQYRNQCGSTLYFVPSLSHFIKLASQGDVDAQLKQSDAISKRHILFIVNDCNGELGSGEGSHFSLLVYERDGNTWYHVDSGGKANAPHAKQIMNPIPCQPGQSC